MLVLSAHRGLQPRETRVPDPARHGTVVGGRSATLMRPLRTKEGVRTFHGCVETGVSYEVIAPPRRELPELAMYTDRGLAPGGRDDERLHGVALDAIERRWLVGEVQDPDRDEVDARSQPVLVGQVQLHPGLLQLDLTGGTFDLDLVGLEDPSPIRVRSTQFAAVVGFSSAASTASAVASTFCSAASTRFEVDRNWPWDCSSFAFSSSMVFCWAWITRHISSALGGPAAPAVSGTTAVARRPPSSSPTQTLARVATSLLPSFLFCGHARPSRVEFPAPQHNLK